MSANVLRIDRGLPAAQAARRLEAAIKASGLGVDLPVNHHFFPGAYLRELPMPAGTVVVGKLHRTEHALIVTWGEVYSRTDHGTELHQAGDIIRTMPGTKRTLYTENGCKLVTVHVTQETDLGRIEAATIYPEVDLIEFDESDRLTETSALEPQERTP